ncbi:FUN14 domain-containing protein 2-like isoform 1-T2 [Dama dama]
MQTSTAAMENSVEISLKTGNRKPRGCHRQTSSPKWLPPVKVHGFHILESWEMAATAVGGGFFLLQLANHTGYIKVDWQRVEKDMKKAKEQLKIRKSNQIPSEVKSKAEEVVPFVKKNVLVTGGFFGGFLLGMAS